MSSYINLIATAVPSFHYTQPEILEFMIRAHRLDQEKAARLLSLYRATGIKNRNSVLEDYSLKPSQYKFYPKSEDLEPFPSTSVRMEVYKKNALPLALKAIHGIIQQGFAIRNITHLIVVSCTGMYAPGLDIGIIESLQMPTDIQRTAINFMGCYAAFNALKVADSICNSDPAAQVLIVCLELCTLHFQKEQTDENMLANSLFGDGSAAVVVSANPIAPHSIKLMAFYSDLSLEAGSSMTWNISNTGFEMILTNEVPAVIKKGIKQLTCNLFKKLGMSPADVNYFAIHPGGRKILEVIEQELGIDKFQNRFAYNILRDHGNMSSPTILFVIKNLLDTLSPSDHGRNILSFAFGPGLTMESMLLQIVFDHGK
jgi:predicted naringenin-chalcone synthase